MSLPINRVQPLGPSTNLVSGEAIATPGNILVVAVADGKHYKATDAAGLRVTGMNVRACASGEPVVAIPAIYKFDNSTTAAITNAHVGGPAYVENATTVANTSTHLLIAGRIRSVDATGVIVDMNVAPSTATT